MSVAATAQDPAAGREAGSPPANTLSSFDRFATWAGLLVSRASFFVLCVAVVVLWLPSIVVLPSVDTWQLVINTVTTIITFLLVALLQNTQCRNDAATQDKLNAIADALSDLMGELSADHPLLERHRHELADAVGLENREGTR